MKSQLKTFVLAMCMIGVTMPALATTMKKHTTVKHHHIQTHYMISPVAHTAENITQKDLLPQQMQGKEILPFDFDVPGQALVSTGPYVGVPIVYAGSDLIVNSPSVNTDLQLLGIRKSIDARLAQQGIPLSESHSHLLFSGVLEGQAGYTHPSAGPHTTDIDLSTATLDATMFGPSEWTLGFLELAYDGSSPANSVYTSTNSYRVSNSRVYVSKAFITLGNLCASPFYATIGQFYVPFATYSSVMVSDPLTKLITRTKARALLGGFEQQDTNAFYGSIYGFRGDSHVGTTSRVNNGGINLGYKFDQGFLKGKLGTGFIANIADSSGMQFGNGFANAERIAHRVPGYNLRGVLNLSEHIDVIGEFVGATRQFDVNDMSYNQHGAKPSAYDIEGSYSFYILDQKPSSIGVGYAKTHEALALGLPLNRYSVVFNTSLFKNTLQSIEFRRDHEYGASNTASGANAIVAANENGKFDNAVTMQFDYYF